MPPRNRYGAIPFRITDEGVTELLLVRTTAGKWSFPKGKLDPGEAPEQAARRECHEESGAVGAVLVQSGSITYTHGKPATEAGAGAEHPVQAFLLRVTRLEAPESGSREPTWFGIDEARAALAQSRGKKYAGEFSRVVDWAAAAIAAIADKSN